MKPLPVQTGVACNHAFEALCGGDEAQRFLDCRRDQRRIGNDASPRIGIVVKVQREHAHETRQRLDARHA
jgi:hypothetical protein